MEILIAESLGFCMGVKRAVDLAQKAVEKSDDLPVVTLGPLIHNAQETARLETQGIREASEETLPEAGTVVIRAHGVAPQVYESLKSRGLKVMDGTCPYVHYSQRKAIELKEDGYEVVIAGDRNHAEIIGILGCIDSEAYVVKTLDEALALPFIEKAGAIAQTTLSAEKYSVIVSALASRVRELKVCETICDATVENQLSITELAAAVDVVYVIGGRHSANSNKLVERAMALCKRSYLIETPDEITREQIDGANSVGVSAGASTPDWMIRDVVKRLRALERIIEGAAAISVNKASADKDLENRL
jgi:(E)-4-hydroxy-3-methyl-but-2-enyl pyrophosphate reductase